MVISKLITSLNNFGLVLFPYLVLIIYLIIHLVLKFQNNLFSGNISLIARSKIFFDLMIHPKLLVNKCNFLCRHVLEFVMNGHVLPHNMTVYQAVQQYGNANTNVSYCKSFRFFYVFFLSFTSLEGFLLLSEFVIQTISRCLTHEPLSHQYSIFIPPGNVRKHLVL